MSGCERSSAIAAALVEFAILLFTRSDRRFPGGSVVKNSPAKQEAQVQSLAPEDPLEEKMATRCSILAWKIPWTEEPGRL